MNDTRSMLAPLWLAAATLTVAGLLWVGLSGQLDQTGMQMDALLVRRAELLRERAAARMRHAQATDPRRLAERARTLGFGPGDAPRRIQVAVPGPDHRLDADGDPLSIHVSADASPVTVTETGWPLLSLPHATGDERR